MILNSTKIYKILFINFVQKCSKIRLRLHQRACRIPELPGPLSGPWTPAVRDFALRAHNFINSKIPPSPTTEDLSTPLSGTVTIIQLHEFSVEVLHSFFN